MEASVEVVYVETFMEASVEAFMEASTEWKWKLPYFHGSFHGSFHELPPKMQIVQVALRTSPMKLC